MSSDIEKEPLSRQQKKSKETKARIFQGFLLMLCMRVYTRQYIWHISVPMLGGVLTALTDETIQIFSPGRSSQVTDVWLDSAGVLAGILTALVLMALCRLLFNHRNKE